MHFRSPAERISASCCCPGLGGDARLFHRQRRAFPQLTVPPWIPPEPRETLEGYAARLAAGVRQREPLVLGGASFGGMLALEMARHLAPRAVVLLGSALAGSEVRWWLRSVERLARALPSGGAAGAKRFAPLFGPLVGLESREDIVVFSAMLQDSPSDFLRWAGRAIASWRWSGRLACPLHRLHGTADLIIRPPPPVEARLIEGAGHILSMSRPAETNAFLREVVEAAALGHAPVGVLPTTGR